MPVVMPFGVLARCHTPMMSPRGRRVRIDRLSNLCSNRPVRWEQQRLDDSGAADSLFGLRGLVRSVRSPDFSGVTFHEVRARSVLNKVPGASPMPFRWTVNPYRGCTHACKYCFARGSHTYLDFDAGNDFDSEVVVKVNAAEALAAQLRKPSWTREHVAMGTNTDPYQRAEGRYQLMPGIIRALAGSGTPFSILTKGTMLTRDLPLLTSVARDVPVGLGVSLALLGRELQRRLEPGTPTPQARLEMVRKAADAGLRCQVFVAPILPGLTDSAEQLDELLEAIASAGATSVMFTALHLRPGTREWFMQWLGAEHPDLVPYYERLYARGSNAATSYRRWLAMRTGRLVRKHGLDDTADGGTREAADNTQSPVPGPRTRVDSDQSGQQLSLL